MVHLRHLHNKYPKKCYQLVVSSWYDSYLWIKS
jgi:hypothetical protein